MNCMGSLQRDEMIQGSRKIVSFRFMYLSKVSGWWISELERLFWRVRSFSNILPNEYLRWREMCRQMTYTWQLKEVECKSSLSGQSKVDERQDSARGGIVDCWGNDLPSKAQIFTSLDGVPFGCPTKLWVSFLKKRKMGWDGGHWTVWPFVIGIETSHQIMWGCQKAKMARIAHQGDIGVRT